MATPPKKPEGKKRESEFGKEDVEVKTEAMRIALGYADQKGVRRALERANVKTVWPTKAHNTYWRQEAILQYVLHLRKQLKDLNDKTFDTPENVNKKERISQLDQRRIRQMDVKTAILERQWAPIDALETAVTAHNQNWRNAALSVMPKLKRKYPEIPIAALEDINKDLIQMVNTQCELQLDEDDFKT